MSEAKSVRIADDVELSRRELLRRTVAVGLAAAPGIVLISACAPAPKSSQPAGNSSATDVDYTLRAVKQQASPDGRPREVFCYDGQIPGPVIRAKLGQKLRVRVKNEFEIATSVHWHGQHQPGTWQMDGVAHVSRPPIAPGEEFVYEFEATPAGTHWYHSHTGVQYGDGLFGPLIVEEETPLAKYDRDEILLINDWFLTTSEMILAKLKGAMVGEMPGMKMKPAGDGAAKENAGAAAESKKTTMKMPAAEMKGDKMSAAMADMKMPAGGATDIGDVPFESALINGRGRFGDDAAPLAEFQVKPGEVVRLRLINGSTTYALRFQVDSHRLTVIASDGAPLVPVEVDNLIINIGERFDVLLRADGAGSHWIRAATLAGDETRAVLRYADAPAGEPSLAPVVWGERMLMPADMRSPTPAKLAESPREIRLKLGGSMEPFVWTINGQEYPQADPIKLATDETVRFVMENPTGMDHPFHLHGHYFRVLGSPDALNLTDPPQKDTVNIPAGQTVVLEWQATNPGKWFYHCHIEWHAVTGMARVIEIG